MYERIGLIPKILSRGASFPRRCFHYWDRRCQRTDRGRSITAILKGDYAVFPYVLQWASRIKIVEESGPFGQSQKGRIPASDLAALSTKLPRGF